MAGKKMGLGRGLNVLIPEQKKDDKEFVTKPKEVVKSRLMKLEREHIQYVMKCLNENSTKVRNMKQYVLATLYNAPLTISNFHKSWVNYDMANGLI